MEPYIIMAVIIYGFCMLAQPLSKTILTAPILFIALGFILAQFGIHPAGSSEHTLHLVAEIALTILLFVDAAKLDPTNIRKADRWPIRMLVLGLPLVIGLGIVAGLIFLPGWPIALIALAAAILAPTDAALGQPVVSNPALPERQRDALTVESGLNDGLALPLVLLFASIAGGISAPPEGGWLLFGIQQIGLGALAGAGVAIIGGTIVLWANGKGYTEEVYEGIAALTLTFLCYMVALQIGGNGFVAAFIGGLGFGAVMRGRCKFVYEFTESEGSLLAWLAFFMLGLVMVPEAIAHLNWTMFGLIMVSLFIVRPLGIWLSLIGSDADNVTRLFFGWFGPRGLATALFALLILDKIEVEYAESILYLAINAVWISALLHGISAAWGAKAYARYVARKNGDKNDDGHIANAPAE